MSTKSPFRCIVSADLFSRAALCVSAEHTRYYLNGVLLDAHPDGGVLLVAMDGHKLVAIRDPEGKIADGPAIIRATKTTLAAARRRLSLRELKEGGPLQVVVHGQRLAVAGEGYVSAVSAVSGGPDDFAAIAAEPNHVVKAYQWCDTLIDGTFPDWKRLIPVPANGGDTIPTLDPRLLATMGLALGVADPTALKLIPTGKEGHEPVLVLGEGVDGFGIVMPRRINLKNDPLKWAAALRPAAPPLSEVAA